MTPLIVYLDQNQWVQLARSRASGTDARTGIDTLRDMRRDGAAIFPLSASHYMETWHRGRDTSRLELARLMKELSGYSTFAPVQATHEAEAETLLYEWFSDFVGWCDCRPLRLPEFVLGRGVNHAFDSPYGRFRFVEWFDSSGPGEGPRFVPEASVTESFKKARDSVDEGYEWWSLAGEDMVNSGVEGLDIKTQRRRGEDFAQAQQSYREALEERGYRGERLRYAVFSREVNWLLADVLNLALRHDFDLDGVKTRLDEVWDEPTAAAALEKIVPTRYLNYQLSWQKLRNPQWRWVGNDLADLAALCVAGVYADVVVTERAWAHALEAAGVEGRWGTRVLTGLPALYEALDP